MDGGAAVRGERRGSAGETGGWEYEARKRGRKAGVVSSRWDDRGRERGTDPERVEREDACRPYRGR